MFVKYNWLHVVEYEEIIIFVLSHFSQQKSIFEIGNETPWTLIQDGAEMRRAWRDEMGKKLFKLHIIIMIVIPTFRT